MRLFTTLVFDQLVRNGTAANAAAERRLTHGGGTRSASSDPPITRISG